MRSLRIAHIADTHLGYKSSVLPHRDDDFAASWFHACRAIVDSSPDIIIHAGDVFHHARPDWKALTAYTDGVKILLEAEVPIFIIAGNHDTSALLVDHTVFTFTAAVLPQIYITNDDEPQVYHLPELETEVVMVPHRSLLNKRLPQIMADLVGNLRGPWQWILVTHGSIGKDDPSNELGSIVIPHSITEYDWSYIALGHLHLQQPYGQRGWYSGSTERCGWSDYPASPSWTKVNLGSNGGLNHTQVPVPYMPMIQLPDINCENQADTDIVDDAEASLSRVVVPPERSNVRIKLLHVPSHRRNEIKTKVQRALRWGNPNAVITVVVESETTFLSPMDHDSPGEVLKGIAEHFKEFVEEQGYESPFKERFLEKGLSLFKEIEAEDAEG